MTKREKVKKLLEISEVNKRMQEAIDFMAGQFRQIGKDADVAEFGDEVANNMDKNFRAIEQKLMAYLEEMYFDLFSSSELDTLIEIHSSPAFRRMRTLAPTVMQKVSEKTKELLKEMTERS